MSWSNTEFPIVDFIARRARLAPESSAFICEDDTTLSYRGLNENACRVANLLQEQGVSAGDRVAILCLNSVHFFEVLFGCAKLGAILVPLNWRQTLAELEPALMNSGAVTLFSDKENRQLADELAGKIPVSVHFSMDDFSELLSSQPTVFKERAYRASDPWYLLYTSGTTGQPKAVIQTYGMALANYINTTQAIDLTSKDSTLNYLPLFHTAGINLYTLPTLIAGGKVYIHSKYEEERVVGLVKNEKISVFFGVPAIYRSISLHPEFDQLPLSKVRSWGCGGAPIQEEILLQFASRNAHICNGFGMTETGPMTFLMDAANAAKKTGSVGKPQMLTEIVIRGASGDALGPGQEGELLMRGANITPGYWQNPEATAKSIDQDGWLHSEDIACYDDEGYYYIVGRIKDMYISGGENVFPAEVERVLEENEDILEVAVIGVPDDRWGEVGCAFVLPKPGEEIDSDSLMAFATDHLAKYKVPKYLIAIDEFPRTAAGKILKHVLKEQWQKEA